MQQMVKMKIATLFTLFAERTYWVKNLLSLEKSNGYSKPWSDLHHNYQYMKPQLCTIPTTEEKFTEAKLFTKLDTYNVYWQFPFDDEVSKFSVLNSKIRCYNFLSISYIPYGIHLAIGLCKRRILQILEISRD